MHAKINETLMRRFALRWIVGSLGLWVAAFILGGRIEYDSIVVIFIAGLVLALVNSVIKPIVVLFSLPAILLSLGLFMVVINGLMVFLVSWLYPSLEITNFTSAVLAGMVIGLVNYLITAILESRSNV